MHQNIKSTSLRFLFSVALFTFLPVADLKAQSGPSESQLASYTGLHLAAHQGDISKVIELIAASAPLEKVDSSGRTALHIAAYASHEKIITALANAGANTNALEHQAYDIVTIAAVANDIELLLAALDAGASASNITSPYDGTALIAAAHLGHHKVVKLLIQAGAPLDHVNNLGWTALIEAVVLGDGGQAHLLTVEHLIKAGADKNIADRNNQTPRALALSHGYKAIAKAINN